MELRILEFSFWVLEFPHLMFFAFLGAVFGSFGKVLLDRMPSKESLTKPSTCPDCGKKLSFWENLPLISYVLLRGKCRGCDKKIPISYLGVEFGFAILFASIWWFNQDNTSLATIYALTIWLFWVIALYDWETLEIPDSFTLGMLPVIVIASFAVPSLHGGSYVFEVWSGIVSVKSAILGMLLASGGTMWMAMYLNKYMSWRQNQEVEVFGFGDVKLMGVIGGLFGLQGAVFALFAGNLIFIIMYIVCKVLGVHRDPHILMVTACDDLDMVAHVKKVVHFMQIDSDVKNIRLGDVIARLDDLESLPDLFASLENKDEYIKTLLVDYGTHRDALVVAAEMSEPMPLGPALVAGGVLYLVVGDSIIALMGLS
jgi:prepilin signal peptidase PulO-like enzyme (type II secretory pathway)